LHIIDSKVSKQIKVGVIGHFLNCRSPVTVDCSVIANWQWCNAILVNHWLKANINKG